MRPHPRLKKAAGWILGRKGIFISNAGSNNPIHLCTHTLAREKGGIGEHLPNVPDLHSQHEDGS
jgi:hypothetical protein